MGNEPERQKSDCRGFEGVFRNPMPPDTLRAFLFGRDDNTWAPTEFDRAFLRAIKISAD